MKKETNSTMKPGSIYEEAVDMLGLCYGAGFLAPQGVGKTMTDWKTEITPPEKDPKNPIPKGYRGFLPYPDPKGVWPDGWTPGIPSDDKNDPWGKSVLHSVVSTKTQYGMNAALMAYNKKLNAYCLVFCGTANYPTIFQNLIFYPVTSGPAHLIDFGGNTYYSDTQYHTDWPDVAVGEIGNPHNIKQPPKVDMSIQVGYRIGLESLTINAQPGSSVLEWLKQIGKDGEFNLFVTGHSLGGALANYFSAWLQAGNLDEVKMNVKVYAWASEKVGNESFITNFNIGRTAHGFHYNIHNSLDTVSQIPLSRGSLDSFTNINYLWTWMPYKYQKVIQDLIETVRESPVGKAYRAVSPSFNYGHIGIPIVLKGEPPIVYTGDYYPQVFFPNAEERVPLDKSDKLVLEFTRQWWQHMFWNYRLYLDRTYNS